MTEGAVITTTREAIDSLPLWYRACADVLIEKGELVIIPASK